MWFSYFLLAFILISGIIYSIKARKLTVTAAFTGAAVACLVFAGAGFTGLAMMTTFFILGSAATSWGLKAKLAVNAAEKERRTAAQVFANAGVAAICGILALLFKQQVHLWQLMMAASFASATADTLSSELGMVYGKRFFNIITLKPDSKGLDGVISLEGTLIGIAGCIIIAVIYSIGFGWGKELLWIIIAGTLGNVTDSLLGATLERKGYMSNNTVNFSNTAIAALLIMTFYIC